MDELEAVKQRLKNKKYEKNIKSPKETFKTNNKYINGLITRTLFAIIILFASIIFINSSTKNEKLFKDNIMTKNISFTKISNLYNKYLGNILPLDNIVGEDKTVFNEKFSYEKIEAYKDGFELNVKDNYLMPVLKSGIVVFTGEKEGFGNTIIVQGIDEIDYWYGNIQNSSVSLYDYISEGTLLGTVNGNKLYLTFQKNGEYLGYDEVME